MRVAGIGLCAHVSMMDWFLLNGRYSPVMEGTPCSFCRRPCRRSTGHGGRYSRQPTVRCTCLSSWHAACAAFALRRSIPVNFSMMRPRVPYLYVVACIFRCWFVWVPPSTNVVHAAGLDTSPHMVAHLHFVIFMLASSHASLANASTSDGPCPFAWDCSRYPWWPPGLSQWR